MRFLKSFGNALKTMVFNPLIFFPMLVVVLASMLSETITVFVLERPLMDMMLFYEEIMTGNIVWIILTRYGFEIATMLISGFFIVFITAIALITIARYAEKNSITDAINDSVKEIGKGIALSIFLFATFILGLITLVIIQFACDLISGFLPQLDFFIYLVLYPILLFGAIIFFTTKLIFVIPAITKNKLKEAIKKSWEFTNKKFLIDFLFVSISVIITLIVMNLLQNIGIILEIETLLTPVGEIIAMTFFALSISYYYFEK